MSPHRRDIPGFSSVAEFNQWLAQKVKAHDKLYRRFLRIHFAEVEEADVMQEAHLRLMLQPNLKEIENPRAFFLRIVRNIAIDQLRRTRAAPFADVSWEVAHKVSSDAPGTAELADRRQELALLNAAIDTLPPRCRDVMRLYFTEDLPQRDIARRLNISERSVHAHYKTGVKRCTDYLTTRGVIRPSTQRDY